MKITFAKFHIEIKKKFYSVQMTPQVTAQNVTSCSVTVVRASDNKTILTRSISGRQIVSPWNAKEILRSVLEAQGEVKPRKKAPNSNYPVGAEVELVGAEPIGKGFIGTPIVKSEPIVYKDGDVIVTENGEIGIAITAGPETVEAVPETPEPVSEKLEPEFQAVVDRAKELGYTVPSPETIEKQNATFKKGKAKPAAEKAPATPKTKKTKRVLKSKSGAYPNDAGVYLFADQMLSLSPKKKTDPEVNIRILELEDATFISAMDFRIYNHGHGEPLCTKWMTFETREDAIKEAVARVFNMVARDNRDFPKVRKFLLQILEALDPEAAAQAEPPTRTRKPRKAIAKAEVLEAVPSEVLPEAAEQAENESEAIDLNEI
jgi:hypothetical protein